ncbi:nucleoside monophosphate kinase [Candidatus Gracilibacteria bacterium]|nr:nucleoside monophosphate kinase [Candidatus Gracilibacteria bacterium]
MNIILFGIQGAGKGTQARAIALALGIPVFEAGAELRKLALLETPEGGMIRSLINQGKLVPPGIVMTRIASFLDDTATLDGVVFDGVPRSLDQAVALDEILDRKHRTSMAVEIRISEQCSTERVLQRRLCSRCGTAFLPEYHHNTCNLCGGLLVKRVDDTAEALKTRIANYQNRTLPVLEYYRKANKLITVNGEQLVLDVTRDVFTQLSPLLHTEKDIEQLLFQSSRDNQVSI